MHCIMKLLILLVWLTAAAPSWAEDIRNQQHGYILKLPAEWQVMPDQQLQAIIQAGGSRMKFEYGLLLRDAQDMTYVLLMTIPDNSSSFTFDQLEASLAKTLNVKMIQKKITDENLEHLIQDVQMGTAYLDRQKKRAVINMDMNVMGAAKLRCLGFGMLGKNSMTLIYCYCSTEAFPKLAPTFEKLANAFSYDADKVYVEPSGFISGFKRVFEDGLQGIIISSSIAGGLAAALFVIFKRKMTIPKNVPESSSFHSGKDATP